MLATFRCILGSIFFEIWVIFAPKMEPSWLQDRFRNRCQLKKAKYQKSLFFLGKTKVLMATGVEVGCQNRSKID